MRLRRGRWILYALVTVAVILSLFEYQRRRNLVLFQPVATAQAPPVEVLMEFDPTAADEKFRDPARLQNLIDETRVRVREINARDETLEHVEEHVLREIDKHGKKTAGEKHVERIWRENGIKYRQTIEWIDLAKQKPKRGVVLTARKDTGKLETIFPFARAANEDDYVYQWGGAEKLGDAWTLKVHFAPKGELKNRVVGEAWIHPGNHSPVKLVCRTAEKIPFVDQMITTLLYGVAETGKTQVVGMVVEGSGGFAMIQKHYLFEIKLHKYREISSSAANTSP